MVSPEPMTTLPYSPRVFISDKDFVKEIVEILHQESTLDMADIDRAIEESNSLSLYKSSHKIAGSLLNFSSNSAYEMALELEKMSRNGAMEDAVKINTELKKEMIRLYNALDDLIV